MPARKPSSKSSGKSGSELKRRVNDADRPDASGTTETESISGETLKREESPQESSIEREIHPERNQK